MQAFELFCEGEFHQAMEKYSESKVDPIKVIALYPDLVPKDIQTAALKSTRQPGKSQIHTLFLWRPVNAIFHFIRCQKIFCAFSAFAYKFNAKLLPDFNSLWRSRINFGYIKYLIKRHFTVNFMIFSYNLDQVLDSLSGPKPEVHSKYSITRETSWKVLLKFFIKLIWCKQNISGQTGSKFF